MSPDELLDLAPELFARDLHDLIRKRRRHDRVVLVYDDHDSHRETLAVLRHEGERRDFVVALAGELAELGTPVTIVIGRKTPLRAAGALPGERLRADDRGVDRSRLLGQLRLERLSDRDALHLLEDLGVRGHLARGIVRSARGVPRTLVDVARYGIPAAAGQTYVPATALARHVRERCRPDDRELIVLAATVRVFNRALLADLADGNVDPGWVERGIDGGMIEPVGGSTREGPTWRLTPHVRRALFMAMAEGDRAPFERGHHRALRHFSDLHGSNDPEDEFARDLERRYHLAALNPDQEVDGLLDLAEQAMRSYRVDRCQQVVDAIEQLYGLAGEKGALLTARLLTDLGGGAAAQAILEAAARRHPHEEGFTEAAVAIEIHRAELDCARGQHARSLSRYEALQRRATVAGVHTVSRYCSWRMSLLHYELRQLEAAEECLDTAETGREALTGREAARADAEARRYGIRRLPARPAHMRRHRARLTMLRGDLATARTYLDEATRTYERSGNDRSLNHARVLRADLLRAERKPREAAKLAEAVRRASKEGPQPDERLHVHALRAEVQARAASGEDVQQLARTLLTAFREVDRARELAARFLPNVRAPSEEALTDAIATWLASGELIPPIVRGARG